MIAAVLEKKLVDPFARLRAYLDRVESIAETTIRNIPAALRDEGMCRALRTQFAREAAHRMSQLLKEG
jgi:hypothetical protein